MKDEKSIFKLLSFMKKLENNKNALKSMKTQIYLVHKVS